MPSTTPSRWSFADDQVLLFIVCGVSLLVCITTLYLLRVWGKELRRVLNAITTTAYKDPGPRNPVYRGGKDTAIRDAVPHAFDTEKSDMIDRRDNHDNTMHLFSVC
jgi:hypothetical protein